MDTHNMYYPIVKCEKLGGYIVDPNYSGDCFTLTKDEMHQLDAEFVDLYKYSELFEEYISIRISAISHPNWVGLCITQADIDRHL